MWGVDTLMSYLLFKIIEIISTVTCLYMYMYINMRYMYMCVIQYKKLYQYLIWVLFYLRYLLIARYKKPKLSGCLLS